MGRHIVKYGMQQHKTWTKRMTLDILKLCYQRRQRRLKQICSCCSLFGNFRQCISPLRIALNRGETSLREVSDQVQQRPVSRRLVHVPGGFPYYSSTGMCRGKAPFFSFISSECTYFACISSHSSKSTHFFCTPREHVSRFLEK